MKRSDSLNPNILWTTVLVGQYMNSSENNTSFRLLQHKETKAANWHVYCRSSHWYGITCTQQDFNNLLKCLLYTNYKSVLCFLMKWRKIKTSKILMQLNDMKLLQMRFSVEHLSCEGIICTHSLIKWSILVNMYWAMDTWLSHWQNTNV